MTTKDSSWSTSYILLKLAATMGMNRNFVLKQLNSSDMIVANEIKVTQGDCGIDLIATYKKNF
ncbi:19117_t:CDS:2, partial [Gigaspora rosea]